MSFIKYNNNWINESYNGNSVTHTGTLTETITLSLTISGNTYKNGDLLEFETLFGKTGTISPTNVKFYWVSGSTATLSGAIQIAQAQNVGLALAATFMRRLYIRTANGTGSGLNLGTEVFSTTTNSGSDINAGVVSNIAIDWTVDGTIFTTLALGAVGVSITQYYLKIWNW